MKLHKPINNPFLLFAIVFLANLLLKLINLGFNSFDYDESISLKNVGLEFGHIKHEAEWDNNPPFYYYCLWVWHHFIEINEFNSRLLSVIFNSLAISLFAVFVSKKVSVFAGVATAIMLSFHTMLLYHAQQVRCYSLVLLLVVISSIVFFKFLEKPGIVLATLLGLVNFLIIYTHYIAGIVLIIQGIVLIIHNKRLFWVFSISIILEIGLVLLRFTKKQFLNILGFNKKEDFWLQTPNFTDLNSTLNTLSNNTLLKGVFVIAFLALIVLLFVNYSSLMNNSLLLYTGLLAIVP
ncbi:MAG: glycosyltransferase family 39 protein, partial [Bacteroidia bacterium]|nr:glycosyltransferase family 39 protein [Bacteroidia bacterium]